MGTRNDVGTLRLILAAAFFTATASAQQYDLWLRGGQVIDPGNGVNARLDVAVVGDHIAAVEANIPASQAREDRCCPATRVKAPFRSEYR